MTYFGRGLTSKGSGRAHRRWRRRRLVRRVRRPSRRRRVLGGALVLPRLLPRPLLLLQAQARRLGLLDGPVRRFLSGLLGLLGLSGPDGRGLGLAFLQRLLGLGLRVVLELELTVTVSKLNNLGLYLTLRDEYDSSPSPGDSWNQVWMTMGLNYSF